MTLKTIITWVFILSGLGGYVYAIDLAEDIAMEQEVQRTVEKINSLSKKELTQIGKRALAVTQEVVEYKAPIRSESFHEFFYNFLRSDNFKMERSTQPLSLVKAHMLDKAISMGNYVGQDSLSNSWVYSVEYKDRDVNFYFVRKDGKWYFDDLIE